MVDWLRKKLISVQKSQNEVLISTLRLLIAEFQKKEISLKADGKTITDEEILRILKKQIKNRKETIPMYLKAGRLETAKKEEDEVIVIEGSISELFPSEVLNN
jgi:uncharacterized protein YqeY